MHYDKLCNGKPLKIGDMVWLHCPAVPRGKSPKLYCYWQGPYIVHKVLSDILYQIQHRNNKHKSMVVHFNRLKPCVQLPPNLLSNQTNDLRAPLTLINGSRSLTEFLHQPLQRRKNNQGRCVQNVIAKLHEPQKSNKNMINTKTKSFCIDRKAL